MVNNGHIRTPSCLDLEQSSAAPRPWSDTVAAFLSQQVRNTMHQATLIEAAVIRAASLQYTCDSLIPEDDAILSTCDSFHDDHCGGQVEPTAVTDSVEFLSVSYHHVCV